MVKMSTQESRDKVSALARQVRGKISQRHLARQFGIGRDVVSRAESGERLNRPYLLKLCTLGGSAAQELRRLIDEIPDGRSTPRKTIAEVAAEVARRRKEKEVGWGDADFLDEIASKGHVSGQSQEARWDNVLKALKRRPDLWQAGYRNKVRMFTLLGK